MHRFSKFCIAGQRFALFSNVLHDLLQLLCSGLQKYPNSQSNLIEFLKSYPCCMHILPNVQTIPVFYHTSSSNISNLAPQAHSQFSSRKNLFGNRHEVFFLNLEDGYFGCQVNESVEFLQIYELSRLCDGLQDCYMGSDEKRKELKCSSKSKIDFDLKVV